MATLVTPKLLLLDEHTAALDPATADKVLELTKKIVAENHITCLMITHNMHAALELGNRTLMMDSGTLCWISAGKNAPTPRWTACWTSSPKMWVAGWIMTASC